MIDGIKPAVLHGDSADVLLVSARAGGHDERGLALFIVDARSAGITRDGWHTHDGRRAADIRLDGVRVAAEALIGVPGEAAVLIESTLQAGIAAIAAEAVGAMESLSS